MLTVTRTTFYEMSYFVLLPHCLFLTLRLTFLQVELYDKFVIKELKVKFNEQSSCNP